MSTRYNDGSHYENHPQAAQLHDLPEHTHRAAEEHKGKQDHLTGQEHSRQEHEHHQAHDNHSTKHTFGHHEIATRAHEIWEANGRPEGTADADWHQAAQELRARHG